MAIAATKGMFSPRRAGFTLVELMVSMSVITLLMLILLSTLDQTQRIWKRSTEKISQFQSARAAFDSLTRNLSQATLNTYYGVEYTTDGNPSGYYRESELHFVSGKAAQDKLLGGSGSDESIYPTHALFFQAPLGHSAEIGTSATGKPVKLYRNLNHLLTGVGYYIKWGEDEGIPEFLRKSQSGATPVIPKRNRFRLMEVIQPAESLSIYATPDFFKGSSYPRTTDWIQAALGNVAPANGGQKKASAWVRAENIVALVVLPKLPERDRTPAGSDQLDLAPSYEYDTRPASDDGRPLRKEKVNLAPAWQKKQFNQLPPVVQVVMVAIDEPSAMRQEALTGDEPPEWTKGLFKQCKREGDLLRDLGDPSDLDADGLVNRLGYNRQRAPRMDYRIYSADVVLRGAKWSAVD